MAKSGIVFLVCISTVPVPLCMKGLKIETRGHYSGQLLKTVYFKYVAFKGIVLHQQLQGDTSASLNFSAAHLCAK